MTASCRLFYGPGADYAAQRAALDHGPYAGGPYGASGLKIDEAREVARLCMTPAPGDLGRQSVVVGPMDAIRHGSADALLKSIEELQEFNVRPFLWCADIGEVRPTIVSRCLPIWSPSDEGAEPETSFTEAGARVMMAFQKGNLTSIIDAVENVKGNERELLVEVSRYCMQWALTEPKPALDLWDQIRETLNSDPVSPAQAVSTLWPPQLS